MGRTQMEAELATEPEAQEITTDAEEVLVLLQHVSGVIRRIHALTDGTMLPVSWWKQVEQNVELVQAQLDELQRDVRVTTCK